MGNVVLKASEGLAKMMSGMIREEFSRSLLTKLMGLAALLPLGAYRCHGRRTIGFSNL